MIKTEHNDNLNDLIRQEEFFYANCIVRSGVLSAYRIEGDRIEGDRIVLDDMIDIDRTDITGIFQNFVVDVDGATYIGGEADAHGSCGFFLKRSGDKLDWLLMSRDSNPFVRVEMHHGDVSFVSSSGQVWRVGNDDISQVHISHTSLGNS